MELLITFLYILFILSAIVLVVVILLQEGKGGGLTGALGVSGQQTFGVGASGINRFTGWTGAIFLVSALGIHFFTRMESEHSMVPGDFGNPVIEAPPAGQNGAPAGGTGTTTGTASGTTGSAPAPTGGTPAPAGGGSTPPEQPKK